jgi:hypothetical protein
MTVDFPKPNTMQGGRYQSHLSCTCPAPIPHLQEVWCGIPQESIFNPTHAPDPQIDCAGTRGIPRNAGPVVPRDIPPRAEYPAPPRALVATTMEEKLAQIYSLL